MNRLTILGSMIALAVGTVGCGNSGGQGNSLVDVGPSVVAATPSEAVAGNLTTLGKGGGGGKPGGGGTTTGGSGGTISIVLLNSTDGTPHFGQDVTFTVSTTATTKPWVTVRCYVGGTLVEKDSNGIFAGSLDQIFTLGGSPLWQSGDADCTATLENWDNYSKNGSITALTSMSFHVYP
jgi:hypothetical protein